MPTWEHAFFQAPLLCTDYKYYLVHGVFVLLSLLILPSTRLGIYSPIINLIPFLISAAIMMPAPINLATMLLSIGDGSFLTIYLPFAITIVLYFFILRSIFFRRAAIQNRNMLRLLTILCASSYFIGQIAACNSSARFIGG